MNEHDIGKMSDRNKLFFELFKHITTMNTAAILFFAAIVEKASNCDSFDYSSKLTIGIIFGLFVASLLASLASMWFIANGILIDLFAPEGKRIIVQLTQLLAGSLLVIGLSLVAYVSWEIYVRESPTAKVEAPPARPAAVHYNGEAPPPVYSGYGATDGDAPPPAPAADDNPPPPVPR